MSHACRHTTTCSLERRKMLWILWVLRSRAIERGKCGVCPGATSAGTFALDHRICTAAGRVIRPLLTYVVFIP